MLSSNTFLVIDNKLPAMGNMSINEIFAENLAALMKQRDVNQTDLSSKSKVSQKTVSNYLNPQQRTESSTGKMPSAKLTELAMIADALDVEPWKLLRPLDANERAAYEAIENAFRTLNPRPTRPALIAQTKTPKAANRRSS